MGRPRKQLTSKYTDSEALIITIMNLMARTKDDVDYVSKIIGIHKTKVKQIHREQTLKRERDEQNRSYEGLL